MPLSGSVKRSNFAFEIEERTSIQNVRVQVLVQRLFNLTLQIVAEFLQIFLPKLEFVLVTAFQLSKIAKSIRPFQHTAALFDAHDSLTQELQLFNWILFDVMHLNDFIFDLGPQVMRKLL